ncbi:hypothetical protein [Streptomyces pactum]|uniref:hypothetical protein n=1 Tax=Streptomyces pactum TaxID=68249 RepID=UPI0027DBDA45|nr:hypothetical protein [Streptomyces pactum]
MSSSSGTVPVRRGRMRRVGESAFGVLLLVKQVVVALIASVVLVAGVWASWGTAQHVMLGKGRERGTLRVQSCGDEWCTGGVRAVGASGGGAGQGCGWTRGWRMVRVTGFRWW